MVFSYYSLDKIKKILILEYAMGSAKKKEDDIEVIEDEESTSALKSVSVKKVKEKLNACLAEKQEYLDGWQRAKADFINARKRLEASAEKRHDAGVIECATAFLPVLDSLKHALDDTNLDDHARKGIEMIEKQFNTALKTVGVEAFDPVGEVFDPHLHDPMDTQEVDSEEEDEKVVQTLQRGYRKGDELIRPAKVRVGKFNGKQK